MALWLLAMLEPDLPNGGQASGAIIVHGIPAYDLVVFRGLWVPKSIPFALTSCLWGMETATNLLKVRLVWDIHWDF